MVNPLIKRSARNQARRSLRTLGIEISLKLKVSAVRYGFTTRIHRRYKKELKNITDHFPSLNKCSGTGTHQVTLGPICSKLSIMLFDFRAEIFSNGPLPRFRFFAASEARAIQAVPQGGLFHN
jgi:hypothetical protein